MYVCRLSRISLDIDICVACVADYILLQFQSERTPAYLESNLVLPLPYRSNPPGECCSAIAELAAHAYLTRLLALVACTFLPPAFLWLGGNRPAARKEIKQVDGR